MIRNISFNLGQMLNRCWFLSNTPLSVAEHLETDKKWIQHAQRFSVEHNSILKSSKKGRVACLVKQSIKREADVLKANSSFLHPSLLRSMGLPLQIRREKSFSYHSAGFWWSSCSWPLGEVNCVEKATVSEHLNASLLNHIQDTNFISFWVLYR